MTILKLNQLKRKVFFRRYGVAIAGATLGISAGLLYYAFFETEHSLLPTTADAAINAGTATAIDGDDLLMDGKDHRLSGIDAFEKDQRCGDVPCGIEAQKALAGIVAGKQVTCKDTGERDGKRVIALCFVGTLDIQEEMVRSGWALVRRDFAGDRAESLCALEAEAAAAKRGAWGIEGYSIQAPYFWKGGRRKTQAQVMCPAM